MLNAIYNYIHCKLFSKSPVGRKRRIEECSESTPNKLRKMDSKDACNMRDSCEDYQNLIDSKENCHYDENGDGCFIIAEVTRDKWGGLPTMARKSIRKNSDHSEVSVQSKNTKTDVSKSAEIQEVSYQENSNDVQIEKYVTNSKRSAGDFKSRNVSDRIFKCFRTPADNSANTEKMRRTSLQNNVNRRIIFLQESYRLTEKYQYCRLLQSLIKRSNPSYSTPTSNSESRKISKSSIPLIDLTKEKSNVTVDRSRENLPQFSHNKKDETLRDDSSENEKNTIRRINSFKEYIKTNPVTEEDIVEQILSKHSKASLEKKKQAALEAAKIELLNDSNRKAYDSVLEKRLKTYMRITNPVIVEEDHDAKSKYKLPSLTKGQEYQIDEAFVPSPSGQILAEKFGLQIKRRDMQTLKGLNWLNDEVINFYMNLIMERSKQNKSKLPNVYAFNTFFYPKLVSSGHASLKRWTKKIDIFSYDMILVPVHLGMHWCMSVIDFRSKEVKYYDSMGSENNTCLQALLTYLEDESMDKRNTTYSTKDWKKKNMGNIPQQMNGSDCGVFSCMFAEHLSRDGSLLFTQANMPYFRRKMVLEILEGRLLT